VTTVEAARDEVDGRWRQDQRRDARVRSPTIVGSPVAHHECLRGAHAKRLEREPEETRVGLLDALLDRDDACIAEVRDALTREHGPQIDVEVADDGDGDTATIEIAKDRRGVRIERVVGRVGVERVHGGGERVVEPVTREDRQRLASVHLGGGVDAVQAARLPQGGLDPDDLMVDHRPAGRLEPALRPPAWWR
jgi:hypothetical protein